MDSYSDYVGLKKEFAQFLGYSGKFEIPDALVRKIAKFIDAHPTDTMASYYARSLLDKFYRRRTKNRSVNLFNSLNSYVRKKNSLIDLFFQDQGNGKSPACVEDYDIDAIWAAIDDLVDGYAKANYIGTYSYLFTDEIVRVAYQAILAMPDIYKTRALAGIFSKMDKLHKAEIFSYICQQFLSGSAEAAYRLKLMFPYLDGESRTEVISLHLGIPDLPEEFIAYLVIRNAQYLQPDDANRIVMRARNFQSDYLRNRCLLKLIKYLPDGEVEVLFKRFMDDFNTQESNSALIHNLYHFGAALTTLEKSRVIGMALEKIAHLDDSQNELFNQQKYVEMLFIMPLLSQANRTKALAIAETVRGGYKRTLIARLQAHFSQNKEYCELRYPPICY